MTRQEVIELARAIVKDSGGQVKAAEMLGVTQPSISKALRDSDSRMDEVRKAILERIGGYTVQEEVIFTVVKSKSKRVG